MVSYYLLAISTNNNDINIDIIIGITNELNKIKTLINDYFTYRIYSDINYTTINDTNIINIYEINNISYDFILGLYTKYYKTIIHNFDHIAFTPLYDKFYYLKIFDNDTIINITTNEFNQYKKILEISKILFKL